MTAVTPGTPIALPPSSRWSGPLERLMDRIPLLEKEMLLVSRLVQPGWTCLDIGAAGGTYLHLLSRLVGTAGRVVGVEPRRASAALLRRLRRWLAWRNVTILQVALGAELGMASLVVPRVVRTEAHLLPPDGADRRRGGATQRVAQWTLDALVERAELERVDLIKCDVEGAEELVFGGGEQTIRRWKPVVLCEIEERHLERYGRSSDGLLTQLHDHGYRTYRYRDGRLHPVRRVDTTDNDYVFVPRDQPAPRIAL